ncbi:MAG: Hsp20/alpha crystallin family protein [Clostridia bacterium]|nr:Hsp20/alpha crystallin family protein [Deltaproteobacteria bacterium]
MLNDTLFGPFRAFDPLRELVRLQADASRASPEERDAPAFNVWARDNGAQIAAELPGFKADAINISVLGKTLTIEAERAPFEIEGATLHRRERGYGRFERRVELPFRIDAEKVEAKYVDGVLTVTASRAEADNRRTITVNAN